ncbi:MAG: cadherin-like domain-containing protein, partial [Rubripirellula sp.]
VVKVSAVNDAPVVVVNTGATVPRGSAVTIAASALLATDVDNSATELAFELTALPVAGVLQLNGTTLVSGGTFTQSDIDGDLVRYVHDGGDSTADSFQLNLTDGSGGAVSDVAFSLTISDLVSTLNFNDYVIGSYGGSQDSAGGFLIVDGGATLEIAGNHWKKIDFAYEVTADTVLEFDFRSGIQGEIHGIGFDTDLGISKERTFALYGLQNWG